MSPNVPQLPTMHLQVYSTNIFLSFPRMLVESLHSYFPAKKRQYLCHIFLLISRTTLALNELELQLAVHKHRKCIKAPLSCFDGSSQVGVVSFVTVSDDFSGKLYWVLGCNTAGTILKWPILAFPHGASKWLIL